MEWSDRCRVSTEIRVMYFDTDAGGVVHNLAYLRFIEIARTNLAINMGMSFEEIRRTQVHPVLVRTEIDYRRPALLGDQLVVNGGITEVSRVRFWVEFEIVRPADQAQLVTCRQSLALLKMPECRPLRLPEGFPESFTFSAG
jgi:YbgC/YbaW family acyl-CoA thioester hydrolase